MIEKLTAYFEQQDTDEILLNGIRSLTIVGTTSQVLASPFSSHDELIDFIFDFAWSQNVRLDARCPSAGGVYRDEFRWHTVIPPIAADGALFSLRRHRFSQISLQNFACYSRFENQIDQAVSEDRNIFICGPTGAGKSTFLSALLRRYFFDRRVIWLETLAECKLLSPSWLRLCARGGDVEDKGEVSILSLLHESLRLRPDKIVIAEARGSEIDALQQAMQCGHGGVFTTLHARSVDEVIRKFDGLRHSCAVLLERSRPPRITDVISIG